MPKDNELGGLLDKLASGKSPAELKTVEDMVNAMPALDSGGRRGGGKLTGPKWEDAEPIYDKLLAGGKNNIVRVIEMFEEVDDGKDYKARYLLHGLGAYTGRPGKDGQRDMLLDAILSQIGGKRPKEIQKHLIRELAVYGDKRAAATLGKVLLDADLCADAAMALVAIRTGAAEQLRAALPKAETPCRLQIVQALGVLKDDASTEALRQAVADKEDQVRIAAAWSLANIGDPAAADLLLKGLRAEAGWERFQAAKACLVLAEKLAAAGKAADADRLDKQARAVVKEPPPPPPPAPEPVLPEPLKAELEGRR
jgi:hypothetical protein